MSLPAANQNLAIMKQIVSFITSKISPGRIILFGSYARGDNREDSDIDILIIELVPKLIDYALKRMVLEQALAVFRPMAYKTAVFKGSCSKN